jgi:hypothetical protein
VPVSAAESLGVRCSETIVDVKKLSAAPAGKHPYEVPIITAIVYNSVVRHSISALEQDLLAWPHVTPVLAGCVFAVHGSSLLAD